MPYSATVLRVMIASPSDVTEERLAIRQVVDDWNAAHSVGAGTILMPLGWDTHATPEMGAHPQEVVNRQLLRDSDILVAVFWTRLGTQTAKAASGTVEEIEEHVATGKPAMIYFSDAPTNPSQLDTEQYAALATFRSWCQSRGLVETYSSREEFRQKFTRHLASLMARLATNSAIQSTRVEPRDRVTLSTPSVDLLMRAAASQGGRVIVAKTLSEFYLQVGAEKLFSENTPRSRAQAEASLKELVAAGLVETRGSRGDVFAVTQAGFEYADAQRSEGNPKADPRVVAIDAELASALRRDLRALSDWALTLHSTLQEKVTRLGGKGSLLLGSGGSALLPTEPQLEAYPRRDDAAYGVIRELSQIVQRLNRQRTLSYEAVGGALQEVRALEPRLLATLKRIADSHGIPMSL